LKYDSKFERVLDNGALRGAQYHPRRIRYVIPEREAWYEPDWTHNDWIIEGKGRFRNSSEVSKYFHIRDAVEKDGWKFVFVFQKPEVPMPGAKKRKNGTKMTHAEWSDRHGFIWTTSEKIWNLIND
jgi:hypothetical protein